MTDFSKPQRMSRSAFFIMLAKNLKKVLSLFIIMIIVALLDSNRVEEGILTRTLVSGGVFVLIALLMTCGFYMTKRFYVKDGNLIYTYLHGWLQRDTVTIPLDKVQTLRTRRGLIYQLFRTRGISFDTLASKTEEIELILDEADWHSLLSLIKNQEKAPSTPEEIPPEPPQVARGKILRFGNKDLVLDALCQNHLKGAAVFGGILAVIFGRLSDLSESVMERILDYSADYLDHVAFTPLLIVALVAVFYVVVLILWLGKVILRYFDMSLTIDKTHLTFRSGLIAHSSCRFAYDKICTLYVKRNFLEKKLGLCTSMLRQALFASKDKEEDNLKLYGHDTSSIFLKWWLGDHYDSQSDIISSKSGKGVLIHGMVPSFTISLVVSLVLGYFELYAWICLPVAYFLITVIRSFGLLYHSRITLKDSYVVIENGRLADIKNYIKYENVEVVRLMRTPFTRWFHRVSLSLSTPGTAFMIRSLKEDEATKIYELMHHKAELLHRVEVSAQCFATVGDKGGIVGCQL